MSIILENITTQYKNKIALDNLSFEFNEAQSWAIFGPNGAGKSTLLKVMMGLVKPSNGMIQFENVTPQDIVYLPQITELNKTVPMSVYELVALGLWYEIGFFKGLNKKQRIRIHSVIEQVDLIDLLSCPISELSRGQLQRVLFAKMLVQDAKFYLLDEPFSAIDLETIKSLLDVLIDLQHKGKSIIAVLHDFQQIQFCFSHTLLLSKKIIASGLNRDIFSEENMKKTLNISFFAESKVNTK